MDCQRRREAQQPKAEFPPKLLWDEAVPVPQPCHMVRSFTVNDGSPQSRCAVHLGCRYSRSDLDTPAADHVCPYKADIGGPKPSAPNRFETRAAPAVLDRRRGLLDT